MGLATFNIFIAMVLSTTVLSKAGEDEVTSLNQSNIAGFVNDIADVTAGLRQDMDEHSVVTYLLNHLTEGGRYKTVIDYSLSQAGTQERELEMDRMGFISHVLQGIKSMQKHEALVDIEYINIEPDGQSATIMITNYERGLMPAQDEFGDTNMVPVLGTSFCEQRLVLGDKNNIQMDGATCTTTIDFEEAF